MGIKQFLKEKKELIKTNRRLITLGCGVSAVMVAIPSITGVVTSQQEKNKKDKDKYYYTPGEIRFDENGKLIIPEIIDKDKPSNGYQYKLEPIEPIDFNNELFNQEKFKKDLKANLTKTFDTILKSDKYKMDFEFEVTNDIKLLIKNLITDKDLGLGKSVYINDFMNTIVNECINNPNYDILTQYNPEQLCALSGVDINKEYNSIMVQINNNQNISLYGGAGSLPNKPNNPTFNEPNKVDLNNITIKEYYDNVLSQNEYYQHIFLVTYSIVLPVFIALNIILNILNPFTFGSLTPLIIETIADVIFCTVQISYSALSYNNTINLKNKIKETIECFKDFKDFAYFCDWSSKVKTLFSINKEFTNISHNINVLLEINKDVNFKIFLEIQKAISIAKISLSILSLAFSITMTILESNLIIEYEL